jgi:hypothetical protein
LRGGGSLAGDEPTQGAACAYRLVGADGRSTRSFLDFMNDIVAAYPNTALTIPNFGLCPDERLGGFIVGLDESVDMLSQLWDGVEGGAA